MCNNTHTHIRTQTVSRVLPLLVSIVPPSPGRVWSCDLVFANWGKPWLPLGSAKGNEQHFFKYFLVPFWDLAGITQTVSKDIISKGSVRMLRFCLVVSCLWHGPKQARMPVGVGDWVLPLVSLPHFPKEASEKLSLPSLFPAWLPI